MDKSADKFIHKENFQEVERRSKKKWGWTKYSGIENWCIYSQEESIMTYDE